jgi:hypothetical protein
MNYRSFFSILALIWFAAACDADRNPDSANQSSTDENAGRRNSHADSDTNIIQKTFEGKGLTYIVREDKSLGVSVSRITIVASDSTHTDSLNLGDKDPVQSGMLADLDENGHDELYLITRSVGTGIYAHIFGFMRDEQNKLVAIEVPEVGPTDQSKGKKFDGYMGHDSVYIDRHSLVRKYPMYKTGDANDKPTGGMREVRYRLMGNSLEIE